MLWFHRLQQRFSLTRNEAVTLIVLAALFSGGLLARHVQQETNPVPPDAYAEADREFFERSARRLGPGGAADTARNASRDVQPRLDAAVADTGRDEALPTDRSVQAEPAHLAKIDINRASSQELQQLPRIGPKTAERIIEFREAYGPFGHVDDLVQVRGIGPKTMDNLRPLLRVEPDSSAR